MAAGDDRSGEELVGVAYADDPVKAEMIKGLLENGGVPSVLLPLGVDGPQVGIGLLNPGGGSRRVMVRRDCLEQARALLAEVLVEDERWEWSDTANARHLDAARGGKARNYSLLGAYARVWLWCLAAMALAFGIFLLLRTV